VELSFVFAAIRRRIWLVALFTLIGLLVGAGIDQSRSATSYEARSTLLVQPPTSPFGGTFVVNDPDRYVIGQLAALRSFALAQSVAEGIPGETASSVQSSVRVSHRANTDLVDITARSDDPERAQQIANAYATRYIGELRARIENQQAPGLAEFNARLADINERLKEVQERIIASEPTGPNPDPRRRDAAAEAERETLRADYSEILRSKTQLEAGAYQRISSEVVERAALPLTPTETSAQLFIGAGLLAGLSLGIVAAIMAARMSPMVIDRYEIETILATPLAGDFAKSSALARSRVAALQDLPAPQEQVASRLAARAQANAVDDRALVVAVVGTQRGAGVSTLALALAGRFARTDNNVVLIDFDTHDPELTRSLASGTSGMPALLSYLEHASSSLGTRGSYIDPTTIFAGTPVDRVRVLGVGSDPDTLSLRRSEISRILEYSAGDVDVVIADAGSLPDAAAADQLLRHADCVVLAVPMRRLRAATLETVGRLVASRSELVLPVVTHPTRRRRRGRRTNGAQDRGGRRGAPAEPRDERRAVLAGTGPDRDG
jgi:Mrp family chromosome partitioning ATPase